MNKLKYVRIQKEDGSYGDKIPFYVDGTTVEINGQSLTTKINEIDSSLQSKVVKQAGKGLSTNDYINEEKQKLNGIEAGATNTEIDSTLSVEGAAADAKATGDKINLEKTILQQTINAQAEHFNTEITELQSLVGSPLVATTAAEMTDIDKIYVYVGSETGYINGNWYYYNGTSWVSGGIYNAVALATDPTLTQSGQAADAKVVGDKINDLKSHLNAIDYVIYPTNLIGNEANVLYPIAPLVSGDALTISTSNGQAVDQNYIFTFYDVNKSQIGQSRYKASDGASKTFDTAATWAAIVGTAYISIDKPGTVPFQCEYGRTATTYTPYRGNGLTLADDVATIKAAQKPLSDTVEKTAYDFQYISYRKNLIGNEANVLYPIVPLRSTDYLTLSTQSGEAPTSRHIFDFYDSDKTLLGSATFEASHGAYRTLTIGTTFSALIGARYIKPQQTAIDPIQIEYGQAKTTFEDYYPNGIMISEMVLEKAYNGKSWMVIGDSLTDPTTLGTGKIYADYVSDNLGMTVINKGVGGTGYWRGTDVNNAFYQRIAAFTETAPDIITFFGSFNDLGTDSRGIHGTDILGTASDSTADTVGGCINLTLDAAITYAPDAILGIMAPTEWQGYYYDASSRAYVQLLEDIAKYRGIPFLNLYTVSNLRPNKQAFRNTYYLNADGTHPNTLGHKRFSGLVEQFIRGICYV